MGGRSSLRAGACVLLIACAGGPAAGGEPDAASAGAPAAHDAEPAAPPNAAGKASFACEPDASAEPAELRRLTMTQYRNTVRDLVRFALGDAQQAERVMALVGLERVPVDRREPTPRDPHGTYRRLDQAVDQTHVDETHRVALALGAALGAPERLEAVVGPCAVDEDSDGDEACLSDFIRRFGARALRRPLDADDERFYRVVYGSDPAPDPAAYADLIAVLLSAPEFLYFVEHGEAESESPGTYLLSPHELASRLSYHFWQTMPDDALWQAAEDGSLLAPDVLERQVERLLSDPHARAAMAELFSDLLELDAVPALDAHVNDPVFAAFAGDDLPGPDLREQVIDEALDLLAYYTWTDPAGVLALFTSELSFARGEALARLYGVAPWDGRGAPPELPRGERSGLLSRAWFLASGTANTRPIRRGVFLRRRLLCDELAPPPAGVNAVAPALSPGETTRQAVERLTEQPGTACASCHATLINPLGFVFEGFDALGRVRHEQVLFDEHGAALGALPVDTSAAPHVTPGDARIAHDPTDLVELMLESSKLEACLARHYFRFTFGRYEDLGRDGCALERLRARLAESGRLREMLAEVARLPELRERRFSP
jgi:hypothetical protein